MGSQTLEIIRQGVWASLTGGWFYDPHQNVFCNAIHLYLWLFLLCAPFVTYLYFPTTFTTWGVYCITTTFTITMLKIVNMALHVLYDKAQAISDPNLKVTIKGSKENEGDEDCGIEMQVLSNDNLPSRTSVEQPINEVSEANSMLSINEHVTSTIDLKVDVHRKNSSESSGSISIYPTGVIKSVTSVPTYRAETHYQQQLFENLFKQDSNNQKQQQQCQNQSDNIKRRYSDNIDKSLKQEIPSQYSVPIFKDALQQQQNNPLNQQQQYRKHHHHRNYSQGHEICRNLYSEIWRTPAPLSKQESLTSITENQQPAEQIYQNINNSSNNSNEQQYQHNIIKKDEKTKRKCKTRLERQNSLDTATQIRGSTVSSGASGGFGYNSKEYQIENTFFRQRSAHICGRPTFTNNNNCGGNQEFNNSNNCVDNLHTKAIKRLNKTSKLQRHRSTESHDDYQRAHNRNTLFFGGRQDNIIGHPISQQQQMSTDIISHHHRATSNNLGLSDMYLANNNYTKSDLVMEQLEHNLNFMHSLLPQTKSMRKDSNSTMSAIQLPVATSNSTEQQKTRRHSNTGCKPLTIGGNSNILGNGQQTNVRRIKSTALEISCQQPSVSNLSPHPNSVEAIAGQQIKNPQSALLPPPSKCLVRNPHLNLCSKFGSINSQSNDLIKSSGIMEPVYPEETETDEKCSISDGGGSGIIFTTNKTNCESDDNDDEDVNDGNNGGNDNNERRNDVDDIDGDDDLEEDDYDNVEKEHCGDIKRCSMTESESEIERPRTQSTDSETDNNGSRSPLLNKNRCENNKSNNRTDEIKIQQQQKHQNFSSSSNNLIKNGTFLNKKLCNNNSNNTKNSNNNNNNGCPSSDCEHMSATSKDMLLEEDHNDEDHHQKDCINNSNNNIENNVNQNNSNNQENPIENNEIEKISIAAIPRGLDIAQEEADIENLRVKDAKSLGAIPKTVMRRSSELTSCLSANPSIWPHKPKSMSRTSSSASSRSYSAESFSNDIYKTYKDHYLFGGIGSHNNNNNNVQNGPIAVSGILGNTNQTNNNTSLGLPAVGCTSFVAYPRRTFVDSNYRLHHKLRGSRHNHYECERIRRLEEFSANYNYDSDDLQKNCLENTTNVITATTATTTALSIQGLMNEQYSFENSLASGDQPRRQSTTVGVSNNGIGVSRGGGGGDSNNNGAANILNVGESIYCEFPWHPCSMSTEKPIQPKRFYKYHIKCFGKHELKIAMDRLQLLALFDRDLNWFHVILAVILSATVCLLGAIILQFGFYKDIFAFIFCVVIAGSLYSLLKSVQPDAASPIHGFNKTVAYSRPIYFCLCSGLLIFSNHLANEFASNNNNQDDNNIIRNKNLQFFGIIFSATEFFRYITDFMSIILLFFPIFFSLGLFPQINTFCMYIFEQIDMHIFGGNATCSLISSILCVLKSILAVCILYGPAFGGLTEQKGTQHFLFSFFCALLIPIAYHLSRSASDFSHIWAIIKSSLVNTYKDDDDDETTELNNDEQPQQQLDDEKSTNVQHGSSTKEITNPSSLDDIRPKEFKDDIIDDDLTSQQSKTIYSTESKLDIVDSAGGDCSNNNDDNNKTDEIINNNTGDCGTDGNVNCENESTTATLSSAQPADNLQQSNEQPDPLPKKLQHTVNCRLKNDLVVSTVLSVFILSLHCSTVFTVLQPDLNIVLYSIAGIMGFLLHYIIPQLRKHMPWLCFARPLLKQKEFGQFEVSDAAKIMWFEGAYVYLCFLERNVLYPLIFISAITADSQNIVQKYGIHFGAAIVSICALKCVRNAYSDPANQYLILVFSVLLFKVDFHFASETFLINYFIISILFKKSCDFLLKLQFIVTYIAPWQITWGSAFHAFAQPFSVPHSAMLFLQAAISAILSTPLNPFLGSAIFLTSYVRPIKFWERDYNTRRIDHSNTRLSSQLERDLGADDNNLNSIFYEHLTRSLQHSLCGDLLLGRWGNVNQGDCFVLASDYLNCLVHIIELGNGLCTFQMRGLEFRGTYCQQREVEAISEGVEDNDACCCCNPGHIPRMLSANAMFSTRWLAWQVVAAQYVLEGYSISENLATATLQVFEFRKVLITYYIKSIIYYVIRNPKLEKWLTSGPIQDALRSTLDRQFVDLDIIFNYNLDEDFDFRVLGITRSSFCSIYLGWIQFCYKKRKDSISATTPPEQNPPTKEDKNNSTSQKLEQAITTNDFNNQTCSANNSGNTNNNNNNCNSNYNNKNQSTSSLNPIPFANTPLGNPTENNNQCGGDYLENIPTTSTNPLRPNKKKNYKRKLKFGETATTESSETTSGGHQPPLNSTNNNVVDNSPITKDSPLVSLCLALGLLARRSLATASHSSLSGVEFFLHGLHALFKGDFRITSPRDEWVFADMELLHGVVAPAVKMALKLHQDHFSSPDEYLDPSVLYEAIATHSKDLVISHEADPIWRSAVLRGAPNLLALRHVMEDGSDEYRIIRLTKRFLSFRVIKLNRECVRGLWAGQQQELIYLRNRNPERGSIQNAKQALRNIINSSCDQPIGYPIYVSPLTTSYADTNDQLCQIIGGAITLESIKQMVLDTWRRIRIRCRQGCSSGSGGIDCDIGGGTNDAPMVYFSPITGTNTAGTLSYGSQSLSGTGTRGSLASMNKPNSSTLLAGFLNRERDQERELIREGGRTNRKNQSQSSSRNNDRDRRATLPIASSATMNNSDGGSRDLIIKDSLESTTSNDLQKFEYFVGFDYDSNCAAAGENNNANLSENLCDTSSKSLITDGNVPSGLENYIPEFSCSTINEDCKNTNSHGDSSNGIDVTEQQKNTNINRRSSLFELNRKVIIVDGLEIYDCLDLGRRIDVVWPNEKMRANGGRSSWEDWVPKEGMVGYIRHFWQPNHPEKRFRSNVNRTVYLIEIGERFVPVSEKGIREYNQILNESNTTTPTNTTNSNNLPSSSINTINITTANIPITTNLKRSSIYLSNNNSTGTSTNLHKTLRDHTNYSSTPVHIDTKIIPFTNITTDLDDELLSTTVSQPNNTITNSNPITKIENSNQNNTSHLKNNKTDIFTDIHDTEPTAAEIFENLSNNSTESEDTNGTNFSSRTISENSNSNSTDDNILKERI